MYRKWVLIVAAGLLIATVTQSCKNDKAGVNGGEGNKKPPLAVNVYIAGSQNITSTVNASGTLLSNEEVEIRPELSARVVGIYFKEGTKVSKGQLLLKLDDADLRAQLKKLTAQKSLSQKNVERLAELRKINGVSQQELDAAQTQGKAFDADIEAVETQIRKAEIRAPFSGQIGLTDISEGTYVTPQTLVATLQQTHPLKVDFSIAEKYAQLLKTGSTLHFTVDGHSDTFSAEVYAIEPKIDIQTRTIRVRARTPNPEGRLVPGMFAGISLGIDSRKGAVMVPSHALIPVARGKQLIVSRGGKAEFVPVQTGLRNASLVEITSGIKAGDTIVTTGLMQMRPGDNIKVLKTEK